MYINNERFQTRTIEAQLNQLLDTIEYLQDKLEQARKNKWAHEIHQYKENLKVKIGEYQDLRTTLVR